MKTNTVQAKTILSEEDCTLVLISNHETIKSHHRGVKTLLELIERGLDGEQFCAADKVVGRAAAFLYAILKIDEVYVQVLSEPALAVFDKYNITVYYDVLVGNIINRTRDGICPMEQITLNIDDPLQAKDAIIKKLKELKENK